MLSPKRELAIYFALTFGISWIGAAAVVAPKLLNDQPIGKIDGLMMFPVMLLGPSVAGIVLTRIFEGPSGLRGLGARLIRLPAARWCLALLIPPVVVFVVLYGLSLAVSSVFTPNRFWLGWTFGVLAGLLEEIGWTGFATPRLQRSGNLAAGAVVLGLFWGAWHLPVLDFLGAATPHGAWWLPFCLAFVAAMTAMRVLIVWLFANTGSVPLAQLMHVSSTGALVVFSPPVRSSQEALWYGLYAIALWVIVAVVARFYGPALVARSIRRTSTRPSA